MAKSAFPKPDVNPKLSGLDVVPMTQRRERRAEQRLDVHLHGHLTLGDRRTRCLIVNMCSKGFLIKANKTVPVGQRLRLSVALYPDQSVECTVQVRHVNRDRIGARVMEMSSDDQVRCRQFMDELRQTRFNTAA
jgi:hypothetical protein